MKLRHYEERKLAEEIIASQKVEIEAMKKRLEILKQRPDPEPGGFPAIGGTRGAQNKDEKPAGLKR